MRRRSRSAASDTRMGLASRILRRAVYCSWLICPKARWRPSSAKAPGESSIVVAGPSSVPPPAETPRSGLSDRRGTHRPFLFRLVSHPSSRIWCADPALLGGGRKVNANCADYMAWRGGVLAAAMIARTAYQLPLRSSAETQIDPRWRLLTVPGADGYDSPHSFGGSGA
jgi:hypothetical protein